MRFSRWSSSRRRLRRATERAFAETLSQRLRPPSGSVVDCRSLVSEGLWPPELSSVAGDLEPVIAHVRADLEKIAENADRRIRELAAQGWHPQDRRAEEARLLAVGRMFAMRRVESTLRQLNPSEARDLSG